MFKFVSLLLLLGCAHVMALPNIVDPHVVGGTKVQEGEFPFIVSLKDPGNNFFCGGGLLSERYVVTAAHCLELRPEMVVVGVGSVHLDNQTTHKVEKVTRHPGWNPNKIENDIGLLKLKEPLKLSKSVNVLSLDYNETLEGKTVTALGWGRMGNNKPISHHLLHLNRTVLSNRECSNRMDVRGTRIHKTNVCVTGKKGTGMCFGDSGTPLVLRENEVDYAVGVVSWGIPCAVGFPDVFTRVSSYVDWLKKNMD